MGKSSKKVTVGYRYSWDLLAGLGRGAVNEIVAIAADKKNVFSSTARQVSSNTTIYINKPSLFGGEDVGGEGGIQGNLDILMGGADQVPTKGMLNLLKGLVPGYRGLVTTFFSGLISCYSASPKPWTYRVRRTDKGWDKDGTWYPDKCTILLRDDVSDIGDFRDEADAKYGFIESPRRHPNMTDEQWKPIWEKYQKDSQELESNKTKLQTEIVDNIRTIHAMNPAHILVECATNRDWGRGLSFDDLDLESYKVAADKLYDEKFGLCFRYNRQNNLDTFVQQILDHIGAAQYGDLSTGKLTLKLIRDDYDPELLPLFTINNGILAVQDDDSAGIDAAPNEIVVTYHNPVTHIDGEVRAQNLGAIQSVGLISSSVEYKAIPTHALAARLAQRDLETCTAGIDRLVLLFDRRGGELMPASVFRVSLPDRDIDNLILRVGSIEENEDGSFTITAIQDIFGLPQSSYSTSSDQGSQWTPPDKSVHVVSDTKLIELPYAVLAGTLSAADLDYLNEYSCYLGVMATAPTSLSINYLMQTRASGSSFINHGTFDWTETGELTTAILPLETQLYLDTDYLPTVGEGIIIDDEIMRIDAIDIDNAMITVGRGCVDTLPANHAKGAKVRFFENGLEADNVEYLGSETVEIQLLTQTSAGTLSTDIAPVETITMQSRQSRPYLPGNIHINGVPYPQSVDAADSYQLTFSHRNRILQADQLIDCLAGNIGTEQGNIYEIALQSASGELHIIETTDNVIDLPYSSEEHDDNEVHTLMLKTKRNMSESLNTFIVELPAGQIIHDEPEQESEDTI